MQVHNNLTHLPAFRRAVITIGTFDGVHQGHRLILHQLMREADAINGETVIITFHPHPRSVVAPDKPPIQLLNTPEEKTSLLEHIGIDHLVVVPFTLDFAALTAEEYIRDFLIARFHPHTIIIGHDHHFGQHRQGNFRLLEDWQAKGNYQLTEIPVHVLNEIAISSTHIRNALLAGDIEKANAALGYNYHFEGTVIKGNQLGRTLGYPTANLQLHHPDKLIPGNGVYTVRIDIIPKNGQPANTTYTGMMNIGVRPTVDGTKRMIEVNIFDFDADIYGDTLKISVQRFLRTEQKFNGLDALKEQLAKDKAAALEQ
jgi:riboflavin kinase / FMN adenylyltransferase